MVFYICRREEQIQMLQTELDQEKRMADNLVNDMVRPLLVNDLGNHL